MKKPFETEMDDTRQAVGQIVCLCTTIALHQEFGVGKTRLECIKARIDDRGHYDPGCKRQTLQGQGRGNPGKLVGWVRFF